MEKKYCKYTVDILLSDDYFISSVLHPTLESKEFWELQIENGNVTADDLRKAAFFIQTVQSPKEKMFRKEKEILWEKIEIGNKETLKKKIRKLYLANISAVACLLLVLGISGYFYYLYQPDLKVYEDPMALLNNNQTIQENTDICLVLSDSEQLKFEDKKAEVKYNEKGEVKVNSQMVVEKKERETKNENKKKEKEVVYNQLIVPNGKSSTLLLSDGTKLWVNAGSRVVFPVMFEKDKREIYVDGEVYIEVARNEASPFFVKTNRMQVEVLGTSFNVRSYAADDKDNVMLVTGAVQVKTETGKEMNLSPNQLFTYTTDGEVNIQLVDVYDYICWKDGLLRYKSERLSVILKRLSGYYGKSISWEPEIENLSCTGKLDLKEDIEKVFNGLIKIIPVTYTKREDSYFFSMNP